MTRSDIAVIGAGIVGVCCALYLQREGFKVTIFDDREPRGAASASNAGIISSGGCVPVGTPGVLRRVPKMLIDPLAPLAIRWRYLPRIAPWLLRFVQASRPARVEAISIALKGLLDHVFDSYEPLWKSAGADELICPNGLLYGYESDAAFAGAQAGLALRRRRGVTFEILSASQVRELEPAFAPVFRHGVFYPKTAFTTDPRALVSRLADDFLRQGGHLVRGRVDDVDIGPDGPRALETSTGRRPVQQIVLAAGAWSRRLAARLGSRVPLDTERGYVVNLPRSGVAMKVSFISGDHDFAVTPMRHGLRVSGTVELAGLTAPPNLERARRLVDLAGRLFPKLKTDDAEQWMSFRPSMPDSLPVISRSPRHASVFFAFGHGHGGMTFAGITGKLIAELITDRPTTVDVSPFRVDRF